MPNKKNIIFPIEFDHVEGGMVQSTISIAKFLATDFNVYFLAHKNADVLAVDKKIKSLVLKNPWSISIKSPYQTYKTYIEVRKLMKSFDFSNTFIFTNNVGSELVFSGFGILPIPFKRVFVSRGGNYQGKTGEILKRGFKNVSNFIAISENQKNNLIDVGVQSSLITKIHNGVSIINREQSNINSKKILNLSIVGYINSNKNQLLAVEALNDLIKIYPDLKLNIYGVAFSESDKIYKEKLIKRIGALELESNVIFKGFEKNQTIIFENTDILLSTSLSEGFGRSIVEAMGYEIPCIGLESSGGLRDIITNNYDGILIENDKTELFNAVNKLIIDISFREKIISNGFLTYNSKFTEEIMCSNYLNFIKQNLK